jgi:hypothetical protein
MTGADAEFFEDVFGGAEAGEGGLQEIGADEDGEPDPVGMDPVSESEAGEDHGASEGADDVFEFHGFFGRLDGFDEDVVSNYMMIYAYS